VWRYKYLHPKEEKETVYKGIISLHTKVDMKQFEEVINQDDTPIEFMNHSAVFGMLQVLIYIVPGTKVVMNRQLLFRYQAKILITNQKVDLMLKKLSLIISKTLI
jgi:Fe-S cluster assembly scaffold protein SufB